MSAVVITRPAQPWGYVVTLGTKSYPGPLNRRRVLPEVVGYDTDAQAYITAVEAADGQALETAVKDAINTFVVGCKADGIWNAIKASCILAGARTLSGALVPLVGTAPTSFNFVSGDYNRKTGLAGDGSTKHLDSNRNNNADPTNSRHLAVWVSSAATITLFGGDIGFYGGPGQGNSYIGRAGSMANIGSSSTLILTMSSDVTGLRGVSRNLPDSFVYRASNQDETIIDPSTSPASGNVQVFRGGGDGSGLESNARLAFYSIGEYLDLALLDARVTDLINAFGAAIP